MRCIRVQDMLHDPDSFPAVGRRGRAGRGLPRPEPGAGSTGPGAAQRCRLISYTVGFGSSSYPGLPNVAYCEPTVSRLPLRERG
jgi:hypothetical protein